MTISIGMQILAGALVAVGAYFIGNINNAIMISKLKGKDIRTFGSGNPGTMNMIRAYGKLIGLLTLILDAVKGVVPSLLGWLFMGNHEFLRLGNDHLGLYIGGIFAVLGHIYPVCLKFKGGKGVATILGVCMTAQPLWTLGFFFIGLLFLLFTKIGSLTSFFMMCPGLTVEGIHAAETLPTSLGAVSAALVFFLLALTLFAHRWHIHLNEAHDKNANCVGV
ncbi:MAG: glycerol-3-phosphate acyltransferase, partial [Clostridiales bacterium]|nr:glycerol-3-phosphate acyltransferase [Clostridiales bacterium]